MLTLKCLLLLMPFSRSSRIKENITWTLWALDHHCQGHVVRLETPIVTCGSILGAYMKKQQRAEAWGCDKTWQSFCNILDQHKPYYMVDEVLGWGPLSPIAENFPLLSLAVFFWCSCMALVYLTWVLSWTALPELCWLRALSLSCRSWCGAVTFLLVLEVTSFQPSLSWESLLLTLTGTDCLTLLQ